MMSQFASAFKYFSSLFSSFRSKKLLLDLQDSDAEFVLEESQLAAKYEDLEYRSRLARAGFISSSEKRKALIVSSSFLIAVSLFFALSFSSFGGLGVVLGAAFAGAYLAVFLLLLAAKALAANRERETLFRLPLFLESVILLVESGLGVLPAIQQVLSKQELRNSSDPVSSVISSVYNLSASGIPFGDALELMAEKIESKPLRHVLLHLDVSSSEGGALIPSLRSLSDYAHREWKLSVEGRVKRLENLVVFPVFASVIGLMILTVAVPIVPVVDFFGSIENKNRGSISTTSSPNFGRSR